MKNFIQTLKEIEGALNLLIEQWEELTEDEKDIASKHYPFSKSIDDITCEVRYFINELKSVD